MFNDEMTVVRRFDFQLTDEGKAPAFCNKLNSFPQSSFCTAVCAICNDNDVRERHSKWFRQKLQSNALSNNICGMTHQRSFVLSNVFSILKWSMVIEHLASSETQDLPLQYLETKCKIREQTFQLHSPSRMRTKKLLIDRSAPRISIHLTEHFKWF